MFEKMVLSGAGRRERRLSKFFVGSSIAYMLLAGSALAVSIYVSNPELTGSGGDNKSVPVTLIPASGGARPPAVPRAAATTRPNLYSPRPLDYLVRQTMVSLPIVHPLDVSDDSGPGPIGIGPRGAGDGNSFGFGLVPGPGSGDPPPLPRESKRTSQIVESPHPKDNGPLKVSQPVLQGKAIFRKTPDYPPLARITRKEGSVVVEVVISPDGRVESARAVSGDQLLAPTAVAAALEWKFQPTYLGSVPVRVAGAITFVFKLS